MGYNISNLCERSDHCASGDQAAFTGAAEAMGISSEDDIQALVDEARYGKER